LIFETHKLKNPIDEFIETIFYFKNFMPEHSIERVVPTGHIFIIFELDGIPRNTFDKNTLKPNGTFSKVWVSGMHKNHLSISAPQNSEMLVIQFKPFGSFPFFHLPIHQFNDKVIQADNIFGSEIIELRTQIIEKQTPSEKFHLVENWLTNRFDKEKIPSLELISIINQYSNKSISDNNKIVGSYSKTQKNLINQFKKFCGHTPKTFHRIFRFNEILQQIKDKQKISWSQIAYQFEYSDQSHFIKEFKEFSGFNPQEFISLEHNKDEPNFFPLD